MRGRGAWCPCTPLNPGILRASTDEPVRILGPAGPSYDASANPRTRLSGSSVPGLLVTADVDAPPGQPGREAGVLALLADGQRELEVRHHDPRGAGVRIDDLDRGDPGGRERVRDHLGGVLGPVDDVDLLAV